VFVPGGGQPVQSGAPADLLAHTPVAPPVVELGRLAGWTPLPLSVRDARRAAGPLRERLATVLPAPRPAPPVGAAARIAELRGVVASYGDIVALRDVDLDVHRGEVVALMGRNGAGKSTLLALLAGLRAPARGTVSVEGAPTHRQRPRDVVRRVALVPHDPTDVLWAQSVAAECAQADRDTRAVPGTTAALLETLAPDIDHERHPRDLSEGQRLALALAVVLAGGPSLLALDEPTRGLDYPAKRRLGATLRDLADRGHAIVMATHDVELAAEVADRIVVLADGEIVTDGAAAEVAVSSPIFAPQVSKVLAPLPWLTVAAVAEALAG
jgi:energy-coupling factor transport system ATP-binding protein